MSEDASREARELFRGYLEQHYRGESVDWDALCASRPELSERLRGLHADWQQLLDVLEHLAPLGSFDQRLRERYGAGINPAISLDGSDERSASDPSTDLLKQLSARKPKGARYRIKGEIGRGGMGAILRVWDDDLRRHLAMKVVLGKGEEDRGSSPFEFAAPAPPLDRAKLARFLEEAQITGQLDHPGIVPVHELGLDHQGRVYFTMRLVKGRDLREVFDLAHEEKDGWNQTRAVSVMQRVCEAMAYAHEKGVAHRDLKPSNVMVGRFGETYVMDWGLARVVGSEDRHDIRLDDSAQSQRVLTQRGETREQSPDSPLLTREGDVLGTPCYMAPEQANGRVNEVGPHSDVYSVGAMLYHLLTGQMPYVAKDARISPHTILQWVIEGPPKPVHQLNPQVPAELVAICEKAMARDPKDRYAKMLEMADDLRAYLEQRVVKAYETGAIAELRKWVVRNKALAASLLGGVVTLAAGLIISWTLYGREQVARGEAQANAEQARKNEKVALSLSGIKRLQELRTDADKLWPRRPHMIEQMEQWLARAEREVDLLPQYESYLAEVRGIMNRTSEQDWLLENLALLLDGLKKLADPDPKVGLVVDVKARLDVASTIEQKTIDTETDAWNECIDSIAKSALYHGLELEPQMGLVPLGEDPDSKLWEFWVWESGERPERYEVTKRWKITGETGIVLVLLPGGETTVGSMPPTTDHPARTPYADLDSEPDEGPLRTVRLDPFFIAKYEVSQGQWLRFKGANPSQYDGTRRPVEPPDNDALAHPVESLSRLDGAEFARRLEMDLPTEAQWEYACRAGSTTVFCTGSDDYRSLQGYANIADRYWLEHGGSKDAFPTSNVNDGFRAHAPVGSFTPNRFGLHDMHGNVWEWCRDAYGLSRTLREGDGLAEAGSDVSATIRGGSWNAPAQEVRSANRRNYHARNGDSDLGLRPVKRLVR